MAEQSRTLAELLVIFEDGQADGSITPEDVRDLIETVGRTPYGGLFTSSIAETTISSQGAYVKVAGTTIISNVRNVDMPVVNRLRYIGNVQYHFHIAATISFTAVGNNKELGWKIFEFDDSAGSGAVADGSLTERKISTGADRGSTAIHWDLMMDPNDYIELHVANLTDSANVTIGHMYMFMMGMPM